MIRSFSILTILVSCCACQVRAQVGAPSNTKIVFQNEDDVETVAYSSDGSFLAAIIGEPFRSRVVVWDTNAEQVVRSYEKHLPSGVAFSANDSLIAFEYDRRVAVHDWRSNSETPIVEFRIIPVIWHVEFSNDGKYLLGSNASVRGLVYVWDTTTWTEVHKIEIGAEMPIGYISGEAFTISPDGRYFAAATDGGTLPIHEIETGNLVCSVDLPVKDNSSRVTVTRSLDYSADGTQIVIVTGDLPKGGHTLDFNYDWIRFIDVGNCAITREIEYPVEFVHLSRVRFIDSDRIIVGSSTSSARTATESITIWNLNEGKITERLDHPGTSWIVDLDVSPDGRYFTSAAGNSDPGLVVWELSPNVRTNISEIPAPNTVSSYPNPVVDQVHFSQPGRVTLLDLLGREVVSPEIIGHNGIQIGHLSPGIYLYRFVSTIDGVQYSGKLIKH